MQPVLNIDDVKRVEVALTREGVSVAELMHRAGLAAAREALEFGDVDQRGGSRRTGQQRGRRLGRRRGAARARRQRDGGEPHRPGTPSRATSRARWRKSAVRAGVSVLAGPSRDELEELLAPADVVIDCMLGDGAFAASRARPLTSGSSA